MLLAIVIALLVLVLMAVPVAAVMSLLALVLAEVSAGSRLIRAIGEIYWDKSTDFILVSVPLFVLLGEIMLRSGIATRMYRAVAQWLSWLPGGLMHANIGACTLFAATSGSSVATTATIGVVAYPEIERHGYNEPLFMGSLAAGGTLGILIPPSVAMILFGVLTETSVPELYLAGIIPRLVLASLFMLTVFLACLYRKDWGGRRLETSWGERMRSILDLAAPLAIFGSVVGTIYTGVATPTEAASVGVIMALGLAACYRTLNLPMLLSAFESTMTTTAMILLIVFAALFLNFILGFMGVTQALLGVITSFGLTPVQTMLVIIGFYLILGMFMETLSMMLTTVPIVFPIVMKLGVPEYSGVWFGIVMILLMEAALITPPVGMNLYVAQGIRTKGGKFGDVAIGSLPFVVPMIVLILALVVWPEIATWLPNKVYR